MAAEEPAGEEPAAEEEAAAPSEEPAAEAAPEAELTPKERRRRERSRHVGKAREPRSPEQRHAERLAERSAKSVRRRAAREHTREKRRTRRAGEAPSAAPASPAPQAEPLRKVRQGVVVSNKADKTITVRISIARRHRRYEKIVRSSRTLHAHDENNDAHEGDVVRLVESRPLSRTKRWQLVEVLERAR